MCPPSVYDYLTELGEQWTGSGIVVELGCWLGGATYHLLKGLKRAGFENWYDCFDRWSASDQEVRRAKQYGISLTRGQNTMELFSKNVDYHKITLFRGDIGQKIHSWVPGYGPIDFILFDAPKKDPLFSQCVKKFYPHWRPGTIVGLLDYYQYEKFEGKQRESLMAPVRFIEQNRECFEDLRDFYPEASCRFFRYVKKIEYVG